MPSRVLNLAVVVGNGFTMDHNGELEFSGLDPSAPLDWPLEIPDQPSLSIGDALPNFSAAIAALRAAHPGIHQFDLLREVVGPRTNTGSHVEIEARHFLTLAFRFFSAVLSAAPIEQWRWLDWFRAHSRFLATTVSFNYDLLLERVLSLTERPYHRQHRLKPGSGIVRVFKPHGSADFDLEGLVRGPLSYPLRIYASMNNLPLRIVPPSEWSLPPQEPLIVLPYEENPYSNLQWARPGYDIFRKIGPYLTHCVFVGLSYHPADRAEINHFWRSTAPDCHIIEANRTPRPDFRRAVEASGRPYHVWKDGPDDLPF